MNEILKNWIEIKLERICSRITKGGTPTTYGYAFQKEGINFIKVENLNKGAVDLRSISDFISQEAHDFQKKSQLQEGDLLFSIAGTIGETCIVRKEVLPANTNQALAIIQGFDRVLLPNFLKFQLDSFVARKVTSKARGGAMNNVSLGDLKNLDVLIPPKPEQRAIVAKIEQLFSELDNGIANLKTAKDKLEIYRQAVLKKAFEGELTKEWREEQSDLPTADELLEEIKEERLKHYENQLTEWEETVVKWEVNGKHGKRPSKPKKFKPIRKWSDDEIKSLDSIPNEWKWVRIVETVFDTNDDIVDGPFGSNLKNSDFSEDGTVPVIGISNIDEGFKTKIRYVTEEKFQTISRSAVYPGNIIVAKIGSSYGKTGIYPEWMPVGLIPANLLRIKPSDFYHRELMVLYLQSLVFKRKLDRIMKSTAQPAFNVSAFKDLAIPFMSKGEQLQLKNEIESRLSVCDNILANIEEGLEKSEALRQSILKKAFEGKLLSEEELEACRKVPDWEPAEKLLERIKNQKEVTA